jgi:hypothetical protein
VRDWQSRSRYNLEDHSREVVSTANDKSTVYGPSVLWSKYINSGSLIYDIYDVHTQVSSTTGYVVAA